MPSASIIAMTVPESKSANGGRSRGNQWFTSNMEYGNFYAKIKSEDASKASEKEEEDLHIECKKKIEALSSRLQDCLEEIRQLHLQITAPISGNQSSHELASSLTSDENEDIPPMPSLQRVESAKKGQKRFAESPSHNLKVTPSKQSEKSPYKSKQISFKRKASPLRPKKLGINNGKHLRISEISKSEVIVEEDKSCCHVHGATTMELCARVKGVQTNKRGVARGSGVSIHETLKIV